VPQKKKVKKGANLQGEGTVVTIRLYLTPALRCLFQNLCFVFFFVPCAATTGSCASFSFSFGHVHNRRQQQHRAEAAAARE
jgi:hypothetical protein